MISEKTYCYLTYKTYVNDGNYVNISKYSISYKNELIICNTLADVIKKIPCNVNVFVDNLPLLYQINYPYIFNKIDRTKKHNFKKKYKPIYFYINGLLFRDLSALEIDTYDEFKEFISKYDRLSQVPNTIAGIVRQDFKYIMLGSLKYDLPKIDKEKYVDVLEKAYVGGDIGLRFDTEYIKSTMYSFDITSSYPAVLYYMKYPLGNWKKYDGKYYDLFKSKGQLDNEYLITVTFNNISCIGLNQSIHERFIENSVNCYIEDERLEYADKVTLTCTSLDFETIFKWYTYDSYKIECFYVNNKWVYLPQLVRDKIEEYYNAKKTSNDPIKKKLLNIIYGIFCNGNIKYNYEFDDNKFKPKHTINPFPFQVGVFCSAYARKRLNDLLFDLRDTACYWDTDCIKGYCDDMDKVYDIVNKHNEEFAKLYDNKQWTLGQWKDEGIHDIILIGKKQYIKDGLPKFSGADCKGYLNCTENTVFEKAIKHVQISDIGVRIIYNDKKIKKKVL